MVRHSQLINSCHKFSLDGVSTMRDAFWANDFYWNLFYFVVEDFGKDIPKYSKTNSGSPGTHAHFSSLLLPVLVIFGCFRGQGLNCPLSGLLGSRPAWEEILFSQGKQCSCTVCVHITFEWVPSSLFVQCCTLGEFKKHQFLV